MKCSSDDENLKHQGVKFFKNKFQQRGYNEDLKKKFNKKLKIWGRDEKHYCFQSVWNFT